MDKRLLKLTTLAVVCASLGVAHAQAQDPVATVTNPAGSIQVVLVYLRTDLKIVRPGKSLEIGVDDIVSTLRDGRATVTYEADGCEVPMGSNQSLHVKASDIEVPCPRRDTIVACGYVTGASDSVAANALGSGDGAQGILPLDGGEGAAVAATSGGGAPIAGGAVPLLGAEALIAGGITGGGIIGIAALGDDDDGGSSVTVDPPDASPDTF